MGEFGKRALNKARTKLGILQAMLDLIADTSFNRNENQRHSGESPDNRDDFFLTIFKPRMIY